MTKRLRQDHDGQPSVSRKTPVERHDRVASGVSKRREVRIAPGIRRILRPIGECTKYGIQVFWIDGKPNSRMSQKLIVNAPSLILRQDRLWQDLGIVHQSQETQLSVSTKMARAAVLRIVKPRPRRVVMPVNGEGKRNPIVDVRKKHSADPLNLHSLDRAIPGTISGHFRPLPDSGFHRFARSSGEEFPELLRERSAVRRALFRFEAGNWATTAQTPSPTVPEHHTRCALWPLPARSRHPAERSRHDPLVP